MGGVEIEVPAVETRPDIETCFVSNRDFVENLDLHPSLPEDSLAVVAGLLSIRNRNGDEPFVSSIDDAGLLDIAGEVCGSAAAAGSQDEYAVGLIARYTSSPTLSRFYPTWEDWIVFEAGALLPSFCSGEFERLFG